MSKATHYGHCQVCGARQKLPSGGLSKHGYTVDHGWFNGVCSGAHALPFEQDYSLIADAVKQTKAAKKALLAQIKELKTTTDYVWVRSYYDHKTHWNHKGGYINEKHSRSDILLNERGYPYVVGSLYPKDVVHNQRTTTEVGAYQHGKSLDEKIVYQNEFKINDLKRTIASMDAYIAWQEGRIAGWKPQELEAI